METNTGIRGKRFSKEELIFCLVETVFFGQCYFAANRNHYWNNEKKVLREIAHFPASGNHFFYPCFENPCQFCFCLVEKYFSRES